MLAQENSCAPLEKVSFSAYVELKQQHLHMQRHQGPQFKVACLEDFLSDAVQPSCFSYRYQRFILTENEGRKHLPISLPSGWREIAGPHSCN